MYTFTVSADLLRVQVQIDQKADRLHVADANCKIILNCISQTSQEAGMYTHADEITIQKESQTAPIKQGCSRTARDRRG